MAGLQLGNGKLWAGIISLNLIKQFYDSIFPRGFFVNFNDCTPGSSSRGDIASFANARIYEHLLLNGMAQE